MSFYYGWQPYVPVAERRRQAQKKIAAMKKKGQAVAPVTIEGRAIAKNFWGKSWCDNLERYSDYQNRLPRGRTYVRNGSVVDLQIAKGEVAAWVSGSEFYRVKATIAPVKAVCWKALEGDVPRLRRHDRFSRGASAGPTRQRGDGPRLPERRRPVSGAKRDQALLQLPGLGGDVRALIFTKRI